MPDFADASAAVRYLNASVEGHGALVFLGFVTHSHKSIVEGDEISGSEGQPVADVNGGNLRTSWGAPIFLSPTEALSATNVPYAQSNEDGIARPGGGPYRLRASIGGRFSIQLTIDAAQRIADYEQARLGGAP
jgi:hypothetical protein